MEEPTAVRIESLAHGGDAVARDVTGRVLFIRGGCPGDLVSVRVRKDRGSHALADVAEVLEPSPARVHPPCPHFSRCGGCQWQHVAYDVQLDAKRRTVMDAMERIGGVDPSVVRDAIRSPAAYAYRNKLDLTVAEVSGGPAVGFAGVEGGFVPVDRCLLVHDRAQKAPRALAGALRYLSRGGPLGVERVTLRVAQATPDLEVGLWTRPSAFPRKAAAKVLSDAVGATGVTRVLFKGPLAARDVSKVEILSGRGYWSERLAGARLAVSSPSFFQVNTAAAEELVRMVCEAVSEADPVSVTDLFSGVGTFSVPLAARGLDVTAVESSGQALADLRRNADSAGVSVDVAGGDAGRWVREAPGAEVVVVDPPRAGLGEKLSGELAAVASRRIVYVSCDPATLARDVSALVRSGWRLVHATPVDLFPQTYHVETVAVLDPA